MAGHLDPEIKRRLHDAGLWESYESRKAQLIKSGMRHNAARTEAVRRLAPLFGSSALSGDSESGESHVAQYQRKASCGPTRADFPFARTDTPASDEVRWAVDHWLLDDAEPKHALSMAACGYVLVMRENRKFAMDFMRTVYVKLLPSRAEIANSLRQMDTGQVPLWILHAILRGRDK